MNCKLVKDQRRLQCLWANYWTPKSGLRFVCYNFCAESKYENVVFATNKKYAKSFLTGIYREKSY